MLTYFDKNTPKTSLIFNWALHRPW